MLFLVTMVKSIKRGAQVLPQTTEWVNLPAAERRFLRNSAGYFLFAGTVD